MKLRYNILFFAGFLFSTLVSAQNTVTIGSEALNDMMGEAHYIHEYLLRTDMMDHPRL